jgi:hypothetical protein
VNSYTLLLSFLPSIDLICYFTLFYTCIFQEENNKYFREEKEDGAVYNVYLKKVVYNSFPEVRYVEIQGDVPERRNLGPSLAH